jgi:hypothetical protein
MNIHKKSFAMEKIPASWKVGDAFPKALTLHSMTHILDFYTNHYCKTNRTVHILFIQNHKIKRIFSVKEAKRLLKLNKL